MALSPSTSRTENSLTAEKTPTTFHAWPRLPDELKLEVLSHLLTFDTILAFEKRIHVGVQRQRNSHFAHLEQHIFPLIATRNYKLASLAQETYYKQNTFRVRFTSPVASFYPWPKPSRAQMIRKLSVIVWLSTKSTLDELCFENGERWLFRPVGTLATEATASSKETSASTGIVSDSKRFMAPLPHFANLDTLSIMVNLCGGKEYKDSGPQVYYSISSDRVESLTKLMDKVELVLQARQVSIAAPMFFETGFVSYAGIFSDLAKRATKRS